MAVSEPSAMLNPSDLSRRYRHDLLQLLVETRNVPRDELEENTIDEQETIFDVLNRFSQQLRRCNRLVDAQALEDTKDKVTAVPAYGGLGVTASHSISKTQYAEIIFWTEAYLTSAQFLLKSRNFLQTNDGAIKSSRPMTLAQKIFTQHAISGVPPSSNSLAPGDVIRAGIDWVLASELSWSSMAQAYEELGHPGIFRNDRFWLAGDHVVHPTILETPKIKTYIETAEKAKREFKMTEYQGMNYTIMHTEFVRERAEPGMLAVGSDSHSCSAGAVGCLSIGLGGVDVMMALAIGETWFKVPDSILIELTGKPSFAISGKDVILHILKELKRNTIAAERIVEFAGDGVQYLSIDARFAICNMCTEFGAITGVFVPDAITRDYVEKRKSKRYKSSSVFFRPDDDAVYRERRVIDLSSVEPSVAVYPNPDDVVPVSQKADFPLDGVFIGACTTTEEELVLGALVFQVGLKKGLPMAKGKRHYVPGSLPIVEKLRKLGLLEVYEAAGFTRGPPGCSMCVGLSAEKASAGETWLSSQNRNFKNRMGTGSFGHLSSAVVCAASSFSMKITDPAPFLAELDEDFFQRYRGKPSNASLTSSPMIYAEPKPYDENTAAIADGPKDATKKPANSTQSTNPTSSPATNPLTPSPIIKSRIITLEDFIDTDALCPGTALTSCKTDSEFGQHVLEHTHPNFRSQVSRGQRVVVAGRAFGVGSSRESAVSALKGAGVQCVIAKSFAFIYARNQPSLGLLGIVMPEDERGFYEVAREGEEIFVDVERRVVGVGREGREFGFELSEMEYRLTMNRGITEAYGRFGKRIWEALTAEEEERGDWSQQSSSSKTSGVKEAHRKLQW